MPFIRLFIKLALNASSCKVIVDNFVSLNQFIKVQIRRAGHVLTLGQIGRLFVGDGAETEKLVLKFLEIVEGLACL